jgi:hypothetical protein
MGRNTHPVSPVSLGPQLSTQQKLNSSNRFFLLLLYIPFFLILALYIIHHSDCLFRRLFFIFYFIWSLNNKISLLNSFPPFRLLPALRFIIALFLRHSTFYFPPVNWPKNLVHSFTNAPLNSIPPLPIVVIHQLLDNWTNNKTEKSK